MHFICPSLHVQRTFLPPCSLFYSSDAEHRKQCDHITPFVVGIALVRFMLRKETDHRAGAESLMEGNAGCPFGAFKLQP